MSNVAILDKTVCVMLSVSLWSGRRRLREDDLGAQAHRLPPRDLASLGSLKLCDPRKLNKLHNIKRAAERDCERLCVRFLGGYATEETHVETLAARLDGHRASFTQHAREFADDLESEIRDWMGRHPQWEPVIRRALPDPAYVRRRLAFDYQVFRVGAAAKDPDAPVNRGLVDAAGGLSAQLFREIEHEAEGAWERSFRGRDAVGQKALLPIRTMLGKLRALQFIDSRTGPVIARIESVLSSLPKSGRVEGTELSALVGLLHLLSSAERMKAHGGSALGAEPAHESDLEAGERADSEEAVAEREVPAAPAEPEQERVPAEPAPHEAPAPSSQAVWF